MKLGIFCSSKPYLVDQYQPLLHHILYQISLLSVVDTIVYGGGTNGLMGVVRQQAELHQLSVSGHNMLRWNPLPGEIIYDSLRTRQAGLIDDSHAYLILPGGMGTLHELIQVLCENDVHRIQKPVAIYDPENIYFPLQEIFAKMVELQLLNNFPNCKWLASVEEITWWIEQIST